MVLILIHEFGHFVAGRIIGVPIKEFAVGFGPAIFKKTGKKETTYSLRALPLGGYCSFGEGDAGLREQRPLYKIFVASAGPLMNIILAFCLFCLLYSFQGIATPSTTIEKFDPDYINNGLEIGDTVVAIDGVDVKNNYQQLINTISNSDKSFIEITVNRDNGYKTFIQQLINDGNTKRIGTYFSVQYNKISFGEALMYSTKSMHSLYQGTVAGLKGLFTQPEPTKNLTSVVGIVDTMSKQNNVWSFMNFCAILSFSLGFMNLLPIPGLDGSITLFSFIECVLRKKIPDKITNHLTATCMIMLIVLSAFLIIKDLANIGAAM